MASRTCWPEGSRTYLGRQTRARIGPGIPKRACPQQTGPPLRRRPSWTRRPFQWRTWRTDQFRRMRVSRCANIRSPSHTNQLVGYVSVILPGKLLSDSTLHQSRQRGQNVDRRVDLPVVELTVDKDLTLGNVSSQIGDGVGDVCGYKGKDTPFESIGGSLRHSPSLGMVKMGI